MKVTSTTSGTKYGEPIHDIPAMIRKIADEIESSADKESFQAVFILFDGATHRIVGEYGWGKTHVDPVEICRGAADSIEEMSE